MSTAISTSLAPTLPGARTFGRGGEVDRAILRTVLHAPGLRAAFAEVVERAEADE